MGALCPGDPETNSVQEILCFQTHTIRMMYGFIGQALKAKGSSDHPRDYLNFFCLGNREAKSVAFPSIVSSHAIAFVPQLPSCEIFRYSSCLHRALTSLIALCMLRSPSPAMQSSEFIPCCPCRRPDDPVPEQLAPATSYAARALAERRFLIYVSPN